MTDEPERETVLKYLFDSPSAGILSELEGGPRDAASLSQSTGMTEAEISSEMEYLVMHGFVKKSTDGTTTTYEADAEKLAGIIENDENFDSATDALTKMDSYLN